MNLFVVGVGRSGTSLMQSMLASHSTIAYLPETSFVRRFIAGGIIAGGGEAASVDRVTSLLENDRYFPRTGLDAHMVATRAADAGDLTDAGVYRAMAATYAETKGKAHVGDKDPRAIEMLELIQALFPAACVVHMVRDPRDVLLSRKIAEWSRDASLYKHVFAMRVQTGFAQRHADRHADRQADRQAGRQGEGQSEGQGHFVHVVYETLLANPEHTLRTLCNTFGLAFEPGMLAFADKARSLVSQDEMSWKKETLGPLLSDNKGKWVGKLSDWEVALVEQCCRRSFTLGSYALSNAHRRLAPHRRAWLWAVVGAMRLAEPLYHRFRHRKNREAMRRL